MQNDCERFPAPSNPPIRTTGQRLILLPHRKYYQNFWRKLPEASKDPARRRSLPKNLKPRCRRRGTDLVGTWAMPSFEQNWAQFESSFGAHWFWHTKSTQRFSAHSFLHHAQCHRFKIIVQFATTVRTHQLNHTASFLYRLTAESPNCPMIHL